jgi:hypothetical protein
MWNFMNRLIELVIEAGYPDLSLKEARHAALEARMVLAKGGDPALDKRKQKIRAGSKHLGNTAYCAGRPNLSSVVNAIITKFW